jgi:hypothetical protein
VKVSATGSGSEMPVDSIALRAARAVLPGVWLTVADD